MNESRMEKEPEMLSAEAARQILGISRTTMHRLLSGGELHGSKVGGQWRFRRADLDAYVERAPHDIAAAALPALEAEIRWWTPAPESGAEAATSEAKIGALAEAILALAMRREASDIHIEPRADGALIRLRDDGVLDDVRTLPLPLLAPLVAHFKKLGALNVAETRAPQHGRANLSLGGADWVWYLATLPVGGNETMTIQLTPHPPMASMRAELGDLGLPNEELKRVEAWLGQPMGLILVVGPQESGKNTTLTALMSRVTKPECKVMAVEENLDVVVPGAVQVEANGATGLSVAEALHAFFRHDPDVIVAGAVKEREELELLLRGAHNGHLVLAAMDAASFSDVITKLDEMEIEPFVLSSALLGVVAQRLVRRLCRDCTIDDAPDAALVERARGLASAGGYKMPEKVNWKRGAGCAKCRGTGARGRIALYEVVSNAGEIAAAITRRAPKDELETLARASGAPDLFAAGVRAAVEGQTSLSTLFVSLAHTLRR
ncbi:MAG: Flp pilus assembly complex ATPase component TadA [Armatimonadetes bacterium]|nr:Flp pilus assembly complex ATPase component TadA [Armatimonadota bacterium]